jgi:curli production assembly/transport component CsgF
MKSRTLNIASLVLAVACNCLAGTTASASEIVYKPVNPSFGGDPANALGLLAKAQTTNKHTDPNASSGSAGQQQSPLQQFNDMLERSILSSLTSAATSKLMTNTGALIPGTVETANFKIVISDLGNGSLQVTTTDKTTGAFTTFIVSKPIL